MSTFNLTNKHLALLRTLVVSSDDSDQTIRFVTVTEEELQFDGSVSEHRKMDFIHALNKAGFDVFSDRHGNFNMRQEEYKDLEEVINSLGIAAEIVLQMQSNTKAGVYTSDKGIWTLQKTKNKVSSPEVKTSENNESIIENS